MVDQLSEIALSEIALGQSQRNIMTSSMGEYLGRMRTITRLLNKHDELRSLTLEVDENGRAIEHIGKAKGVYRMKFPMQVEHARLLFALISVDESLSGRGRKRKRRMDCEEEKEEEEDDEAATNDVEEVDPINPARDKVTVSTQTFRNYKSALKWWHPYHCPEWGKTGYEWPFAIDNALKPTVASYKRDIALKKRRGIMKQKEGKSGYSLNGYIELNKQFASMKPSGKKYTWDEGMFAGLFTVLSVNTIGRSDNIDDCLVNNIGWENDAMTILFGFIFPSYSTATMWNLWHFGDNVKAISPYRNIHPTFDLAKNGRINFSKCKLVMHKLVSIALVDNVTATPFVTKENEQKIFNHSYVKLMGLLYHKYPNRPNSININTVANRLTSYNKMISNDD